MPDDSSPFPGILEDGSSLTRRAALGRLGVLGAGFALGGALTSKAGAAMANKAGAELGRDSLAASTFRMTQSTAASAAYPFPGVGNHDTLLMTTGKGASIPWLAESWSQPSPTRVIFNIRKGVKFWDGSPLTMHDIVFSITQWANPNHAGQTVFWDPHNIKSVRPTGPHQITLDLKRPDTTFPLLIGPASPIMKESFAKPLGKDYGTTVAKTLGTGPFKLVTLNTSQVVSVRNPHFWGQQAPFNQLQQFLISDPTAQRVALQNGEVDAVFFLSAIDAATFTGIPGVKITGGLGLETLLALDVTKPPFNDVHARRAVAHCWNAEQFINGPLRGAAQASNGIAFPWQWNSVTTPAQYRKFAKSLPTPVPFSIAQAKAELAKSATPNGFSLSMVTPGGLFGGTSDLALQALGANLSQIGIKLDFHDVDGGSWYNAAISRQYPASFMYLGPDYADPNDLISQLVGPATTIPLTGYENSEINNLLAAELKTAAKGARASALKQIYAILARDLPFIPLWWEDQLGAVRAPFHYTYEPFYYFSPWWNSIKSS